MRELISLNCAPAQQAVMTAKTANPRWSPASACNRLPEGWAEFATLHSACLAALLGGNRCEAYDKAVAALQPFIRAFREDEGAWVVHPMHSVVHNLRAAAEAADTEQRAAGRRPDKLADCGDQLRKCFSVSLQAPGNRDKKLAALDIVNVSIKIYFRLSTLRLCKNLIRTVESKQFAPFDSFPASQRVTYRFYLGRLAVFDEQYEEAEAALTYALRHCHRGAKSNKAHILKYLIPVGMLLGRLPSTALSQQYPEVLAQYQSIIQAMRTGDLGMFTSTMTAKQTEFIRDGTYLLFEKLQGAVLRRLLRRVWALHAVEDPAKAAQIPLGWVQDALSGLGCDMDMDEIECVAANLIARKYVKGYISHKAKVMVVAKTDPFPPLEQAAVTET